MDSTSNNISRVVALLTAIISDQENIAYEIVLESDPIELFSALTGILLSTFNVISDLTGNNIEFYLQELGKLANITRKDV